MNNRTNYLQNGNFQLIFPKFPDLSFYATSFSLPGMNLPTSSVNTPFTTLPIPGDRPGYDPVSFTFIIDEQLKNYCAIVEWIKSIAYSTQYDDYSSYDKKDEFATLGEQDLAIVCLDSKNNPIKIFQFINAVPVQVNGIEFTSQDPNTNYSYGQVTFEYEYFEIIDPLV